MRRAKLTNVTSATSFLGNLTPALPGIQILCPGLQNVWKTNDEVSQGYDGICSNHRKSRALQHGEHETEAVFTCSWADAEKHSSFRNK